MVDFIIMMIKQQKWLMHVVGAMLIASYHGMASANCDFDDFPVMEEMAIQAVMDDAVYNNRPMMVHNFIADEASYHDVVDFYHKKWDQRYDDTAFGMWHQISTMTDKCMMTVQVAAQNNDTPSVGRLIISNPPTVDEHASVGEDVIAPPDSVVVSDLSTKDGPKKGRVTMLSTSESTRDVGQFYLNEMQRKGWAVDREFNEGESRVLVFRKGLNINNILIIPAGEMTQVLINEEIIK